MPDEIGKGIEETLKSAETVQTTFVSTLAETMTRRGERRREIIRSIITRIRERRAVAVPMAQGEAGYRLRE
ncbi:MAG: hypothetical protein QW356_04665 [Candidatus Hadarchaeales archaeon]